MTTWQTFVGGFGPHVQAVLPLMILCLCFSLYLQVGILIDCYRENKQYERQKEQCPRQSHQPLGNTLVTSRDDVCQTTYFSLDDADLHKPMFNGLYSASVNALHLCKRLVNIVTKLFFVRHDAIVSAAAPPSSPPVRKVHTSERVKGIEPSLRVNL